MNNGITEHTLDNLETALRAMRRKHDSHARVGFDQDELVALLTLITGKPPTQPYGDPRWAPGMTVDGRPSLIVVLGLPLGVVAALAWWLLS